VPVLVRVFVCRRGTVPGGRRRCLFFRRDAEAARPRRAPVQIRGPHVHLDVQRQPGDSEFFLARHQPGNFYHFEMIPDRLPAELREVMRNFRPGALQFEVGIQTFNDEVAAAIQPAAELRTVRGQFQYLRAATPASIFTRI